MTRRRTLSAALLGSCLAVMVVAVAVAQTGGGYLGGGELTGGIAVPGPGSQPAGGGGGGQGGGGGGGGAPADCVGYDDSGTAHTGPPTYSAVTGPVSAEMDRRSATGEGGSDIIAARPSADAQGSWMRKDCGGYPAGYVWVPQGSSPAAVAPPPASPTADEVRGATPVPSPTFGVAGPEGAAGMPSLLWDGTGDAGRTVSVTIRGYSVTATASPQQWKWDMQGGGRNPHPIITTGRPGSRDDPAATYTYETAGDYTVTLTVTWGGSFTFSGNGQATRTQSLGTTTASASRPYHVAEIRTNLKSR